MADRVRIAVSATPIETITDENAGTHDIVASEVGKSLGGNGDSVDLTNYSRVADRQGYSNGVVNYRDSAYADGVVGALLTVDKGSDFLLIKNTGHKYSSAIALGAITTDCVMVAIKIAGYDNQSQSGWYTDAAAAEIHYIEIAWLKPGQSIVLPLGATKNSMTKYGALVNDLSGLDTTSQSLGSCAVVVKTFQSDGTDATDGNAVEFLAVT